MPNGPMDTTFFDKAAHFAIVAHENTERRSRGTPYIIHCFEAASICESLTYDQEILAAALLHDTIEDTDVTVGDLRQEFGERVAQLVLFESDLQDDSIPWLERKLIAAEELKKQPTDAKIVALGDKLSNLRAIARDYGELGEKLWERFHDSDPAHHSVRWHMLLDVFKEFEGTSVYEEFRALVKMTFGD